MSDSSGTGAVFRSLGRAMYSMRTARSVSEDWSAEINEDYEARSKSSSLHDIFKRHQRPHRKDIFIKDADDTEE